MSPDPAASQGPAGEPAEGPAGEPAPRSSRRDLVVALVPPLLLWLVVAVGVPAASARLGLTGSGWAVARIVLVLAAALAGLGWILRVLIATMSRSVRAPGPGRSRPQAADEPGSCEDAET